jgi:hypothetical protein
MRGRIVNEGTVDEIRALGVRRRIRCVTRVAAAEVRLWPGVEAVLEVGAGAVSARTATGAVADEAAGAVGAGTDVGSAGTVAGRTVADAVADEAVGALSGEAMGSECRLDVSASSAEPIVRRLLAADPQLRELEVSRAGLAEAFVQITKEAA